ncbi:MAG: ABC transporter substrate-binding protein [Candidatus Rokubacteria bacterium]|nr:ABC transporter substrate-binding protein [Candidatus Rokubacteria bacterium]
MNTTRLALAIVALSLGLLVGPPSAAAQQPRKVARIGFLCQLFKPGPALVALRQGLRDLGYVDGQNVVLDTRFAEEKLDRLPSLAAELVRAKVDVLVPMGAAAARAAKQATTVIPIVLAGAADPVGTGLVASLARPGGNITGISSLTVELASKRLELLKQVVPGVTRVGVFWDPEEPEEVAEWKETQLAARTLGLQLQSLEVPGFTDMEKVLTALDSSRVDALINLGWIGPSFPRGKRIVVFAARQRLPAMYGRSVFVQAGGLLSYGPIYEELFRRAATHVHKILNGARPGDLPVEQPTKFELVVNLKAAKALGLAIPPSVLARADKVIE